MKSFEIVKCWNIMKGTKYPVNSNGGDSAIVKTINELIETYGEKVVSDYFDYQMEKDASDIWFASSKMLVEKWIKENENKKTIIDVSAKENKDLSLLSVLSKEIISLMGNELANRINDNVEAKINEFISDKVLTKVYEYKGEMKKPSGIAHEKLDTMIKFVSMDEPVMMVGPAGTGKNVIAKQIAEVLGLEFYFSNAVTQEYKLTGYGDANGNFVKTQFFEAFTKGGLFLLDEIDASCPEALIVLNCAIANRYFDFPVIGRVEANENFRVIACANTYGTGASMEYVGRNQLDGATLNRFAIVEVDYDKRIENNVCPNKDIADFCRMFRKICLKNGIHHIVSYREMSRLYKMIEIAKLTREEALKTCLLKGLERDTIVMIENDMCDSLEYKQVLKNIIGN